MQMGFYSLERGTSSTEVDGAQAAGKGFNLLLGHVWDPWEKAKGVGCASIYFC